MKLFDTIEAVKFPEENMIFITCGGYLYYRVIPVIVHGRALIENCCDNVVGRKQSPRNSQGSL